MKKLLLFSLCAVLIGSMFAARADAQSEQKKVTVKVVAHATMYARTNIISKLFMNHNPNVNVIVEKVPLVQDALASATDSSIDVVMASRVISDPESDAAAKKGVQLVERLIGYGGIVMITDRANSVDNLSLNQLRKLFAGEISNWKEVGGQDKPVQVITTGEAFPGTVVFVEGEILKGASITKQAAVVPDFNQMMLTVSKTPGSIGFVRVRDAFESASGAEAPIKVLKIRRSAALVPVMPSRESIASGIYPVKRPYFLYYRQNAGPEVVNYVEFVLGKGWGSEQ